MSDAPNPTSNVCTVTFDIPWELAEQLVPILAKLLNGISAGLQGRSEIREQKDLARQITEREMAENKAGWATLAAECEAEIRRRANGPGSRRTIIKQLASDLSMPVSFLDTILRVARRAGVVRD